MRFFVKINSFFAWILVGGATIVFLMIVVLADGLLTQNISEYPQSFVRHATLSVFENAKKLTFKLLNEAEGERRVSIARARMLSLAELIKSDTGEFLKLTLPDEVANKFGENYSGIIEKHSKIEGVLDIAQTYTVKNEKGEIINLYFAGNIPDLIPGARVKASGILLGNSMAIFGRDNIKVGKILDCKRQAPSLAITPISAWGHLGEPNTFKIIITNNDSSKCGASTFNIIPTLPSGWSQQAEKAALNIGYGKKVEAILIITAPTDALVGQFEIPEQVISAKDSTISSTLSAFFNIY